MPENEKVERYQYAHLTRDEVKSKVLEQLRAAEQSHISADVNAELNRQNAKLMVEEAHAGKKIDTGLIQQARQLNNQVKTLERQKIAHERAIAALEARYGDLLDLNDGEDDLG